MGVVGDDSLTKTIYTGKVQNAYFKYNIFSVNLSININNSTNVELFDKVDFRLQSTIDNKEISDPYSGEYFVGAISYSLLRNSGYTKRVLLCRHGINKSDMKNQYVGVI
jgi:hypothetical protein